MAQKVTFKTLQEKIMREYNVDAREAGQILANMIRENISQKAQEHHVTGRESRQNPSSDSTQHREPQI